MRKLLQCFLTILFVLASNSLALQINDFIYTINTPDTNTVTITGYTGSGGAVEIPSIISNKPVNIIGEGAFGGENLSQVTIPNSVTDIKRSAFADNPHYSVTIPVSVTNIGSFAFGNDSMQGPDYIYFEGDAPSFGLAVFGPHEWSFPPHGWPPFIFYKSGTTGWESIPYVGEDDYGLWNPQILTNDISFGENSNGFSFGISESSEGGRCVVKSCTNLNEDSWQPLQTNWMNGTTNYFNDYESSNYPVCFYRLSMP